MRIVVVILVLLFSPVVLASEQLTVEVEHQFIQKAGDNIEVFQVMRFVNTSESVVDEVFLGLWSGYSDVSFLGGNLSGEELDGGILLQSEVLPGDSLDITLTYFLPLTVMGEYLEREIRYRTDNFFVLVDSGQLSLRNTELVQADAVSDGNVLWQQYYALKLPANGVVGMVLSEGTGMVLGPVSVAYNQELPLLNASPWGLWLLLTGLLMVFVVYAFWQRFYGGREHTYLDFENWKPADLKSLQKDIMVRLMFLEDKLKNGELPERKYREESKTLKNILAEVTLALQDS